MPAARGRRVERPSAVSSGVAAVPRRNSKKPVRRWNTSSRNRIKPANTSHRERGTYRGWRGMDVQISARFRRSRPPVVLLRAASALRPRSGWSGANSGEYGRHTGGRLWLSGTPVCEVRLATARTVSSPSRGMAASSRSAVFQLSVRISLRRGRPEVSRRSLRRGAWVNTSPCRVGSK